MLTIQRTNRVPAAMLAMNAAATALALEAADITAEAAKTSIRDAVGGGIKWASLPNQSSAPYAQPVNQTEHLIDSIHTIPNPAAKMSTVIVDDPAVGPLETGTNRMAPRPFFTEATYEGELHLGGAGVELRARLRTL